MNINESKAPSSNSSSGSVSTCAICLSTMRDSQLSGHYISQNVLQDIEPLQSAFNSANIHCFHKDCIDEWMTYDRACPKCRTTLVDRVTPIQQLDIAPERERNSGCIEWDACRCCMLVGLLALAAITTITALIPGLHHSGKGSGHAHYMP